MKNLVNKLFLAFVTMAFVVQSAFAATANLKFYTSKTDPKTGEFIELDLKVDGNKKTPYFTYIVNAEYDATKLKFEGTTYGEGWVGVDQEAKTDIEKGQIKRIAGYPGGADKLLSIVKYKFKVLAPGKIEVKITGETALDQANQSAQLQEKKVTLVATGKELTEEIAAIKNQKVTLNITAPEIIKSTEIYQFNIEHVLDQNKPTQGVTTVSIVDPTGEKKVLETRNFNIDKNTKLEFNIPAGTFQPGSYFITAESVYPGQTETNIVRKEFAVSSTESVVLESDNVFVNIGNLVWAKVVDNWILIAGAVFILGLLRFFSRKYMRYGRRDGR